MPKNLQHFDLYYFYDTVCRFPSFDEVNLIELKPSEARLVNEVYAAWQRGERIISIQLAERVGVTRSAVSQTVNRLVEKNVLCRRKAENDKKISYIEFSPKVQQYVEQCREERLAKLEKIVNEYGKNEVDAFIRIAKEIRSAFPEENSHTV